MSPFFFFFFFFFSFSILLVVSTNSWFIAWLAMEINLMSFIPMMMKKNKYTVESALKYFLVQSMGSSMIIMASIFFLMFKLLPAIIIFFGLMLKSGAAPFHQWLPSIADGISWPNIFLLFTIQKISPLCMTTFLHLSNTTLYLFYLHIVSSALVGALGGLNQTSLRKIMSYSSISHMSWMLAALMNSIYSWITYFSLYIFIILSVVANFYFLQMFYMSQMFMKKNYNPFLLSVSLLSLGGLPPFTGFIPKFIVSQELITQTNLFILFILLTSVFLTLFFYARMFFVLLLSATNTSTFSFYKPKAHLSLLSLQLLVMFIIPLAMLT
uniref:NADH-ubiquinone oxidoreductase chain 2 n=1 Tax=Jesogammarus hinumensis TaxID=378308 RepID=A0A891ZKJ0_9CRUS|nr:NADH dehydrogenase subunit 2 [Jesogammarus hinumensis]QRN71589.1 NADH dehydrogenase subunit 2 [Jesogammarus hinumensis]